MGPVVIGLFSVVILGIIALVIVGQPIRFPPPTETTPPPTKPNPEYSPSPTLNPFPTQQTSPRASLSPSPVQIPADQNPCKAEQNGSTINIGFLEGFCPFVGNLSSNNREIRYRFKIGNPSNISLFLDDVNSAVEIYLYSDPDGTGVIGDNYGYTSAYKSQSAMIKKELKEGSYIVVVKLKARDTKYSLQIVNDTSQVENVGSVEQKTLPKNGSVSLKKREQFYGFQLDNPSSISLSLDGVSSEVEMYLYSGKGGVIGDNYGYTSAFNSKPGLIKKELGVGNYIVMVRLKAGETNYTLTMSAP
ncbi:MULTISPECIES: PPC domain-containing protein [unclassified Microcoleus]|uniref:PPC domain-containing protein n=1 Tax=unclassified Microcoleus TaxID=2642155 RepID=UPI002FD68572